MKKNNLQHQYGWNSIQMDWWYIMKLNKKWWISRIDLAVKLIEEYHLIGKQKFLDIWCGDGEMCKKVENKFEDVRGIDVVEKRIKRFYDKYSNSSIKLSVWDVNASLEFDDATFDCITSLVTLDLAYDLNNALSEINRILRKDWIFILEVNNLGFLPRRLKLLFGNYPKISAFSRSERKNIGWDSNVSHVFVQKELTSFLQEFWFEILKITWSGLFYKFRNRWPSLLCGDLFYVVKKK